MKNLLQKYALKFREGCNPGKPGAHEDNFVLLSAFESLKFKFKLTPTRMGPTTAKDCLLLLSIYLDHYNDFYPENIIILYYRRYRVAGKKAGKSGDKDRAGFVSPAE